jgi:hypothetical protein
MRKSTKYIVIVSVSSLLYAGYSYCREGGGGVGFGGFGGGGGGHTVGGFGGGGHSASAHGFSGTFHFSGGSTHAANNAGRGPSMSRADQGRSFHMTGAHPPVPISQATSGVHVNKQSPSRLQVRQYLNHAKQTRNLASFSGQKPQDFRAAFRERHDFGAHTSMRLRDRVRRDWPNHDTWFTDAFFDHHHLHPRYWYPGFNWWRGARWDWLCNFLPWGWSYPIYYYDNGYPIVLPGTEEPETSYQDQLQAEASTAGEWMPLGVFATGQDAAQAAFSNLFIQLAMNKEGDLEGTYYNAALDQTHPIEGEVDPETQQAAWKVSDDPAAPLMITGLYNLTQDMCTVQVRFPDNSEQTWAMVRLKK